MADRNYWVRTEHGRVWGPYTLTALERLRGQLTEKCEASLDGSSWRPGSEFPELRDLLQPARKIERKAPEPQQGPRISKAIAEAFGIKDEPAAEPQPASTPAAPSKPAAPARKEPPRVEAPPVEAPQALPGSGDLEEISPIRLYAFAALENASGNLQLELEKGSLLQISFRRGTPEHLSTDDPDQSLVRFLLSRDLLPPDKALEAEEEANKAGQDIVSVLFQKQLIPTADAHKILGDYASFLLDRALISWRGKFSFEKDAPPPPGAFPLGSRWTLLAEAVRRLEVPLLRARLGKRLVRPVVRSGGLAIGKVDELSLNAQETRIYAAIDGTRTGEELLKAHDPAVTLRLLYLLTELGHLGFAEVAEEPEAKPEPEAEPVKPPPPPPAPLPHNAERAPEAPLRELPKTAREAGRARPPRASAPPVMKSAPPVLHGTQPAAPKPAPPAPIASPPPTFAQPPPDETPEEAVQRLGALLEKLSKVDHFEALGMERKSAGAAEAKRNFFVLAKELHPDTVTDPALVELREMKERLFARINEAAQVVSDDARRKAYVDELEGKANSVDVARIFAAEENFQRAEIFIKARKYKEGLDLLDKAISLNAAEAEFWAWRGYARFLLAPDRKAAFEECAADCRKAIKMQDRCLPAHLFLGHMAKAIGDVKAAKKSYQRVLELDEKHVDAQRELRLMGQKA